MPVRADLSPDTRLSLPPAQDGTPIYFLIPSGKYVDKAPYRTFCLMGDGESFEGNVWEAMNFAGYYKVNLKQGASAECFKTSLGTLHIA